MNSLVVAGFYHCIVETTTIIIIIITTSWLGIENVITAEKGDKTEQRKRTPERFEVCTDCQSYSCTLTRKANTHPSSSFIVDEILSATSNICPNDADEREPVETDANCWKYAPKSKRFEPSYGCTSDARENCPDDSRPATNACRLFYGQGHARDVERHLPDYLLGTDGCQPR